MRHIIFILFSSFCINSLLADSLQHQLQHSPLSTALRIGTDVDGNALFLCRGTLFNNILPGKTWAGYDGCNVPYEGKEYVVHDYTVPNQRDFGSVFWDRSANGAIAIGKDRKGNPLFLCQSTIKGSNQPGKTWPGYNHCNITFSGLEIITDNYYILTNRQEKNANGKTSMHSLPRVMRILN